jgi:hypothetical protein
MLGYIHAKVCFHVRADCAESQIRARIIHEEQEFTNE